MNWDELCINIGDAIYESLGFPAIFSELTSKSLEDIIHDAIEQIEINTKKAIEDSLKSEVIAYYNALFITFREYSNNPQPNEIILSNFNLNANHLVELTKALDIIKPFGKGLLGHPIFMVAANLKLSIQQERIRVFGNKEIKSQKEFLINAIGYANDLIGEWTMWVENQFSQLKAFYQAGVVYYSYFYHGKSFNAGCRRLEDDPVSAPTGGCEDLKVGEGTTPEEAEDKRKEHIQKELKKYDKKYIKPTKKIISQWEQILFKLNYNPELLKAIIDHKKFFKPLQVISTPIRILNPRR